MADTRDRWEQEHQGALDARNGWQPDPNGGPYYLAAYNSALPNSMKPRWEQEQRGVADAMNGYNADPSGGEYYLAAYNNTKSQMGT